jgi:hypothetical protein
MRFIPEEPDFGEGQLAEKVVWEALKKGLPDDAVLAHSVQLRDGVREYEIDLLVLWPRVGIAAIEVKGSKVSVADGQWYQSDRTEKRPLKSPVVQSQGSAHAFKNWIEAQLGSRLTSRSVYMVSFPYTEVRQNWEMAGCPRTLVLDKEDTSSAAELVRVAIEQEGVGSSPLAPAFMDRIVRVLGGTLGEHVAWAQDPKEAEDAQDHLTERQSVLLRATRSLPRIRFTGGAGSGKARLLCKQGKRVGLFSYNTGLSQYLQDQVAHWRHAQPAFTGEFHEYARQLGVQDGKGTDYFEEELPQLLKDLAVNMQRQQRLDAIIVDEAQDFAPLWWEALLATTKDDAEIYAFLDDHQDVYRRWSNPTTGDASPLEDLITIHIDGESNNSWRAQTPGQALAAVHVAYEVAVNRLESHFVSQEGFKLLTAVDPDAKSFWENRAALIAQDLVSRCNVSL